MIQLICNKCRQYKNETEFEYMYFQKEYKHVCKECDKPKPNKIKIDNPGEDLENPGVSA